MSYNSGSDAKMFKEQIRAYNNIFAFTSIGGRIDRSINDGQGPYIFRLSGQNHHLIGSLLPPEGQRPKFAQLYIYDIENEVANRISALGINVEDNQLDKKIISQLIYMFDNTNVLVRTFRMARDRFRSGERHSLSLRLCEKGIGDTIQYNAPVTSEIVGLFVGDLGSTDEERDIIVEFQSGTLKRISDLHPSFMSMQYPLLFPYGDDGYKVDIPYQNAPTRPKIKRKFVTRCEYYAYILQQRAVGDNLIIRGGKLFQQFIVDAFTCIEDERLRYIRFNYQQEHLRSEIYSGVQDAFLRGDLNGNLLGKRIILPASFTGSPRYMIQHYHDAMAICRNKGNPDLFITFTCNVQWIEIREALKKIPGQKLEDRPDLVTRVFHMKLNEFIRDIKQNNYFGQIIASVYTVEFQKRGLPHVHLIIWLHQNNKLPTPHDIDKMICAEIPDPVAEKSLFAIVSQFMVHGPCGPANPKASCMKNGKCTKHFPKKFCAETTIADDGFATYKRRDIDRVLTKQGIKIDNRHVVSYNKTLLLKYEAHINVEWCNQSRAVKYLFKYINKGPDRARAFLQENVQSTEISSAKEIEVIDEVKTFIDCRYLCAYQSCWRIFGFQIHCKYPAVLNLTIHLPQMNTVTFRADSDLSAIIRQPRIDKSMLTEWMFTNTTNADARELTYAQFPSRWRWDSQNKFWFRRKKGHCIGRIFYVHPSAGELYYLRMLLSYVKGATNFTEIRTVNGTSYNTFREACNAIGLTGNDQEWHDALDEAANWATAHELRSLFVTLIMFCDVADPSKLFEVHAMSFGDDITYKLQHHYGMHVTAISSSHIRDQILKEIQLLLSKNGASLADYNLPIPTNNMFQDTSNTLLLEELAYNVRELKLLAECMSDKLNLEQNMIYDVVTTAVNHDIGGLFFVYGHGGTGKTYLYQTNINHLRSTGKIVLAVASSGIAALLLPGGRTAHSRFKIPLELNDQSTCHIKKGTQLADLLMKTNLIVWDEAPLAHRHCFEALDRSLNDIITGETSEQSNLRFGGKTVLLGGDFRQILPVIPTASRTDTINACITNSYLWKHCQIFVLTTNMRISSEGLTNDEKNEITTFGNWLLKVGEGKINVVKINKEEEYPSWIKIPEYLHDERQEDELQNITNQIYDNLSTSFTDPVYLTKRAIITGTNAAVDKLNSYILSLIPIESKSYFSYDCISDDSETCDDINVLYPMEYLNSLSFNGLPNHQLDLKIHCPVMLLRNLHQASGLCNGTLLLITKLADKVIEANIISGNHTGDRVYIPRIIMTAKNAKLPFTMKRRQFPIRLCYAMTINKSQGQTVTPRTFE